MKTDTISKYDLKIPEDYQEVNFKPVFTDMKNLYKCVVDNYAEHEELQYVVSDSGWNTVVLHHTSGSTIYIDEDDGIEIQGTRRAINDARASLELLTRWNLEEVLQ